MLLGSSSWSRFGRQAISVSLSSALLWTSSGLASAAGPGDPLFAAPSDLPQVRLIPPFKLGSITDYYHSPSANKNLVILIQDLHAHYGAQKNISGLLDFLSDKLRRNFHAEGSKEPDSEASIPFPLAVEGASGPVDSSLLALFPDAATKRTATDYLLRQGELTGADDFAIRHRLPHFLVGCENNQYYQLHRDLFRHTEVERETVVRELTTLQNEFTTLRRRTFSHDVLHIQDLLDSHEKGQISTLDFLNKLQALDGADWKTHAAAFPVVARFLSIGPSANTDAESLRNATAEFLTHVQDQLSAQEKKDLSVLRRDEQTRSYYLYLRDLVYQHGWYLAVPPELARYMEYLYTSSLVGMDHVMYEARELAYRIQMKQAATAKERDVLEVRHDLALLLRVTDLQATETEVRDFAPRLDRFVALCGALLKPSSVAFDPRHLRPLISSSVDYYVMAMLRNKPMVDNTLKLLGPGQSVVVLVAGGFHTAPLTDLLRQKQVSYVVLSPMVDAITEADHALYIKRLSGHYLSLDDIRRDARVPASTGALGRWVRFTSPRSAPETLGYIVDPTVKAFHFLTAVFFRNPGDIALAEKQFPKDPIVAEAEAAVRQTESVDSSARPSFFSVRWIKGAFLAIVGGAARLGATTFEYNQKTGELTGTLDQGEGGSHLAHAAARAMQTTHTLPSDLNPALHHHRFFSADQLQHVWQRFSDFNPKHVYWPGHFHRPSDVIHLHDFPKEAIHALPNLHVIGEAPSGPAPDLHVPDLHVPDVHSHRLDMPDLGWIVNHFQAVEVLGALSGMIVTAITLYSLTRSVILPLIRQRGLIYAWVRSWGRSWQERWQAYRTAQKQRREDALAAAQAQWEASQALADERSLEMVRQEQLLWHLGDALSRAPPDQQGAASDRLRQAFSTYQKGQADLKRVRKNQQRAAERLTATLKQAIRQGPLASGLPPTSAASSTTPGTLRSIRTHGELPDAFDTEEAAMLSGLEPGMESELLAQAPEPTSFSFHGQTLSAHVVTVFLPAGIAAYHFVPKGSKTPLIAINEYVNEAIRKEALAHEQSEIGWRLNGFSPREAHRLASIEGATSGRFTNRKTGLTHFHSQDILGMNSYALANLIYEYRHGARQISDTLLRRAQAVAPEIDRAKVEAYERRFIEYVIDRLAVEQSNALARVTRAEAGLQDRMSAEIRSILPPSTGFKAIMRRALTKMPFWKGSLQDSETYDWSLERLEAVAGLSSATNALNASIEPIRPAATSVRFHDTVNQLFNDENAARRSFTEHERAADLELSLAEANVELDALESVLETTHERKPLRRLVDAFHAWAQEENHPALIQTNPELAKRYQTLSSQAERDHLARFTEEADLRLEHWRNRRQHQTMVALDAFDQRLSTLSNQKELRPFLEDLERWAGENESTDPLVRERFEALLDHVDERLSTLRREERDQRHTRWVARHQQATRDQEWHEAEKAIKAQQAEEAQFQDRSTQDMFATAAAQEEELRRIASEGADRDADEQIDGYLKTRIEERHLANEDDQMAQAREALGQFKTRLASLRSKVDSAALYADLLAWEETHQDLWALPSFHAIFLSLHDEAVLHYESFGPHVSTRSDTKLRAPRPATDAVSEAGDEAAESPDYQAMERAHDQWTQARHQDAEAYYAAMHAKADAYLTTVKPQEDEALQKQEALVREAAYTKALADLDATAALDQTLAHTQIEEYLEQRALERQTAEERRQHDAQTQAARVQLMHGIQKSLQTAVSELSHLISFAGQKRDRDVAAQQAHRQRAEDDLTGFETQLDRATSHRQVRSLIQRLLVWSAAPERHLDQTGLRLRFDTLMSRADDAYMDFYKTARDRRYASFVEHRHQPDWTLPERLRDEEDAAQAALWEKAQADFEKNSTQRAIEAERASDEETSTQIAAYLAGRRAQEEDHRRKNERQQKALQIVDTLYKTILLAGQTNDALAAAHQASLRLATDDLLSAQAGGKAAKDTSTVAGLVLDLLEWGRIYESLLTDDFVGAQFSRVLNFLYDRYADLYFAEEEARDVQPQDPEAAWTTIAKERQALEQADKDTKRADQEMYEQILRANADQAHIDLDKQTASELALYRQFQVEEALERLNLYKTDLQTITHRKAALELIANLTSWNEKNASVRDQDVVRALFAEVMHQAEALYEQVEAERLAAETKRHEQRQQALNKLMLYQDVIGTVKDSKALAQWTELIMRWGASNDAFLEDEAVRTAFERLRDDVQNRQTELTQKEKEAEEQKQEQQKQATASALRWISTHYDELSDAALHREKMTNEFMWQQSEALDQWQKKYGNDPLVNPADVRPAFQTWRFSYGMYRVQRELDLTPVMELPEHTDEWQKVVQEVFNRMRQWGRPPLALSATVSETSLLLNDTENVVALVTTLKTLKATLSDQPAWLRAADDAAQELEREIRSKGTEQQRLNFQKELASFRRDLHEKAKSAASAGISNLLQNQEAPDFDDSARNWLLFCTSFHLSANSLRPLVNDLNHALINRQQNRLSAPNDVTLLTEDIHQAMKDLASQQPTDLAAWENQWTATMNQLSTRVDALHPALDAELYHAWTLLNLHLFTEVLFRARVAPSELRRFIDGLQQQNPTAFKSVSFYNSFRSMPLLSGLRQVMRLHGASILQASIGYLTDAYDATLDQELLDRKQNPDPYALLNKNAYEQEEFLKGASSNDRQALLAVALSQRLERFKADREAALAHIRRAIAATQIGRDIRQGGLQDGIIVRATRERFTGEVNVIGDLHENVEHVDRILATPDEQGRTLLNRLESGDAVVVFNGDLFHPEVAPYGDFTKSLTMLQLYNDLKTRFPTRIYLTVGDHEFLNTGIFKGGVVQGLAFKELMKKRYGEEYVSLYQELIAQSSLLGVADGMVWAHGGPPTDKTLKDLNVSELTEDLIRQTPITDGLPQNPMLFALNWGYPQGLARRDGVPFTAKDITRFLQVMGQPGGVFVGAHTPWTKAANEWHWMPLGPDVPMHIVFAAHQSVGVARAKNGVVNFPDAVNEGRADQPASVEPSAVHGATMVRSLWWALAGGAFIESYGLLHQGLKAASAVHASALEFAVAVGAVFFLGHLSQLLLSPANWGKRWSERTTNALTWPVLAMTAVTMVFAFLLPGAAPDTQTRLLVQATLIHQMLNSGLYVFHLLRLYFTKHRRTLALAEAAADAEHQASHEQPLDGTALNALLPTADLSLRAAVANQRTLFQEAAVAAFNGAA